jgi:hypothetical protein
MKKQTISFIVLFIGLALFSQALFAQKTDIKVDFPDIPGYKTLKCEFHQHTVFSDGSVWPEIRVAEAVRYGLDAISITDHLEYQPKKNEIPHNDRNIAYKIALKSAKGQDLLIVRGAEITRGMPPGHLNAIFIEDANKLLADDAEEVIREANNQGAFVFWNHPHWTSQKKDGVAELTTMHKELIKEGLIHGIEIVNSNTYSDEAFQIALDNNLSIMGNTDIHGMVEWNEFMATHHRPLTIVFAREKTKEALKEGLVNHRTAVWFNNTLFGSSEFLEPLVVESLKIKKVEYRGNSTVLAVTIENISDADYILENQSKYLLHSHAAVLTLKAHQTTKIEVRTIDRLDQVELKFMVLNAFTAPKKHPEVKLDINIM